MTTPHNFTINTRWGHTYHKTSTLNLDPKLLTPTETSLFDLLPTDILMYIDIWVSGLKHCDKSKAVIKNMNNLCNPTLFVILLELWATYRNFSVCILPM